MNTLISQDELLARFLEYIAIDTTADEQASCYPSSKGQTALGQLLVDQLRSIGVEQVEQDDHSLVWATLESNLDPTVSVPTIGFCAHLDTSPESSGKDVRPQIIRDYPGGDVCLPGDADKIIRFEGNDELVAGLGKTLITTDGTTLLGADDKAGIAIMVCLAKLLVEHPEIRHGRVRLCFTCDEEIGHGTDHIDLVKFDAAACYTIDGGATDTIDIETFSANRATVIFRGINIHPSIAKGRMVNSIRAASWFMDQMPLDRLSPESTGERDGFLHPYTMSGSVEETTLGILLRSFDEQGLHDEAELLESIKKATEAKFPGITIDLSITEQYRNLSEGLGREPRAVDYAVEAVSSLGRTAKTTIVRGGTDGSRLTEMGLPTPNLSCGGHTPHSLLEWACLEEMAESLAWAVAIIRRWAEDKTTTQKSN
jgi:tripeptide aminopeptidase